MSNALVSTDGLLGNLRLVKSGKVRDIYDLDGMYLVIATDRISTFDVIHPTPIPDKGRILTQLTLHWFRILPSASPHHLITAEVAEFPQILRPYKDILEGRSMLVRKAEIIPVECVVRGYLYGSGWREYQETGSVCGIELPVGLRQADKLPEPIFTPATKAESGTHDENITEERAIRMVGKWVFSTIRERSIAIYKEAVTHAESRGVIIADTKFEFGLNLDNDEIILADEVLTPDSSRFWPAESWQPGKTQPSFDKQPVRDYGDGIGWDHKPPAPELPEDVVMGTQERYQEALKRLIN